MATPWRALRTAVERGASSLTMGCSVERNGSTFGLRSFLSITTIRASAFEGYITVSRKSRYWYLVKGCILLHSEEKHVEMAQKKLWLPVWIWGHGIGYWVDACMRSTEHMPQMCCMNFMTGTPYWVIYEGHWVMGNQGRKWVWAFVSGSIPLGNMRLYSWFGLFVLD